MKGSLSGGELNLAVVLIGFVIYELFFGALPSGDVNAVDSAFLCNLTNATGEECIETARTGSAAWGTFLIYLTVQFIGKSFDGRAQYSFWFLLLFCSVSVYWVITFIGGKHGTLLAMAYYFYHNSYSEQTGVNRFYEFVKEKLAKKGT